MTEIADLTPKSIRNDELLDRVYGNTRTGSDNWGNHGHGEKSEVDGRKNRLPPARRSNSLIQINSCHLKPEEFLEDFE